MKFRSAFFCIQIVICGAIRSANAEVLTFDDLPTSPGNPSYAAIPNGYGNLSWSNLLVVKASSTPPNSGYRVGTISPSNVVFNPLGDPASLKSGVPFDFKSAFLTAAVNPPEYVIQVRIQGFVGTTLTYDNNYTISNSVPSFINFDYRGVSEIKFIPFQRGNWFAMDNLTVGTPEPAVAPTISCPEPLILECGDGADASLQVQVADAGGNPLEVIWTVDDTPYQTNHIPSGGLVTSTNVIFTANFGFGLHSVEVSVSNGKTNAVSCSTSVTVQDTVAPQFSSAVASPGILWPPNNQMVTVEVVAEAIDTCGPVTTKIISVSSNETNSGNDWKITDDKTVKLRAKRLGAGRGRIYTILVECSDVAGNRSLRTVSVTVPHDKRGR